MEQTPWPLECDAYEEILLKHVLEHLGAEFKTFAAVMRELYRVAAPNAVVEIHVPHVRHDTFWSDPTHVRAFTPITFQMMSKRINEEWMANGANYTMLAKMMDVDFEPITIVQHYDPQFLAKVERGEWDRRQLSEAAATQWNVARELHARLRVVKS